MPYIHIYILQSNQLEIFVSDSLLLLVRFINLQVLHFLQWNPNSLSEVVITPQISYIKVILHDNYYIYTGFLRGTVVNNLPANVGDAGLIFGSGRSPGVRNGNPLQYSYQESPMERAWRATVHRGLRSTGSQRLSRDAGLLWFCSWKLVPSSGEP